MFVKYLSVIIAKLEFSVEKTLTRLVGPVVEFVIDKVLVRGWYDGGRQMSPVKALQTFRH
jgi:hypothetical protein